MEGTFLDWEETDICGLPPFLLLPPPFGCPLPVVVSLMFLLIQLHMHVDEHTEGRHLP